jgi:hypothetical protein
MPEEQDFLSAAPARRRDRCCLPAFPVPGVAADNMRQLGLDSDQADTYYSHRILIIRRPFEERPGFFIAAASCAGARLPMSE